MKRPRSIIRQLMSDLSNASIANELFISSNTLKKHTSNIYRKLDVCSRANLKNLLKIVDSR